MDGTQQTPASQSGAIQLDPEEFELEQKQPKSAQASTGTPQAAGSVELDPSEFELEQPGKPQQAAPPAPPKPLTPQQEQDFAQKRATAIHNIAQYPDAANYIGPEATGAIRLGGWNALSPEEQKAQQAKNIAAYPENQPKPPVVKPRLRMADDLTSPSEPKPYTPPTRMQRPENQEALEREVTRNLGAANRVLVEPFEKMSQAGAKKVRAAAITGTQAFVEPALAASSKITGKPVPPGLRDAADTAEGIAGGVGATAGGLVADPRMWPFFFAGGAPSMGGRAMSAGFGLQMGAGAVEQAGELAKVWDNPDVPHQQKVEMGTTLILSALMAYQAGKHAAKPEHLLYDFSRLPDADQQAIRDLLRQKSPELAKAVDQAQAAAQKQQPAAGQPIQVDPSEIEVEPKQPAQPAGKFRMPKGQIAARADSGARQPNIESVEIDGQHYAFDKRKTNGQAIQDAHAKGELWKLTGEKPPQQAAQQVERDLSGEESKPSADRYEEAKQEEGTNSGIQEHTAESVPPDPYDEAIARTFNGPDRTPEQDQYLDKQIAWERAVNALPIEEAAKLSERGQDQWTRWQVAGRQTDEPEFDALPYEKRMEYRDELRGKLKEISDRGKNANESGITRESPAVQQTEAQAQPVAGQVPDVLVKEETPQHEQKMVQQPEPVTRDEVQQVGKQDAESERPILQPTDEPMRANQLAVQAAPELETKISRIASTVPGVKFERLRPRKDLERVEQKTDDQKPPETISDYLAGQVAVDSPEAAQKFRDQIASQFEIVDEENKLLEGRKDKAGYPSWNLQVKMSNGLTAELQIVPREVQEASDESHKYYTQGREAKSDTEKDELWGKAAEINGAALGRFKERNGITIEGVKAEKGAGSQPSATLQGQQAVITRPRASQPSNWKPEFRAASGHRILYHGADIAGVEDLDSILSHGVRPNFIEDENYGEGDGITAAFASNSPEHVSGYGNALVTLEVPDNLIDKKLSSTYEVLSRTGYPANTVRKVELFDDNGRLISERYPDKSSSHPETGGIPASEPIPDLVAQHGQTVNKDDIIFHGSTASNAEDIRKTGHVTQGDATSDFRRARAYAAEWNPDNPGGVFALSRRESGVEHNGDTVRNVKGRVLAEIPLDTSDPYGHIPPSKESEPDLVAQHEGRQPIEVSPDDIEIEPSVDRAKAAAAAHASGDTEGAREHIRSMVREKFGRKEEASNGRGQGYGENRTLVRPAEDRAGYRGEERRQPRNEATRSRIAELQRELVGERDPEKQADIKDAIAREKSGGRPTPEDKPFTLESPPEDVGVRQFIGSLPERHQEYAREFYKVLKSQGEEAANEIRTQNFRIPEKDMEAIELLDDRLKKLAKEQPVKAKEAAAAGFFPSVTARLRNIEKTIGAWKDDIEQNTQRAQSYRQQLNDKSPYEDKLAQAEKELMETNKRLGIGVEKIEEQLGDQEPQAETEEGPDGHILYSGIDPLEAYRAIRKTITDAGKLGKLYTSAVDKLLEKLNIGKPRPEIRQFDPDAADLAVTMDAGGQYHKAVGEMIARKIEGPLLENFSVSDSPAERAEKNRISRDRMKGLHWMGDAQNREWLKENHPEDYKRWSEDPKIAHALSEYKPYESDLRSAVKQLGGKTIDEDYIKRVMDFTTSGVAWEGDTLATGTEGPEMLYKGQSKGAGAGKDSIVSPQVDRSKARKDAGQYYWDHGVYDFGPSFQKRWIEVMSKLDEHRLAVHAMSRGTRLQGADQLPSVIYYNGKEFYRGDIAKDIREVKKHGTSAKSKELADALGVSELPTPKDVREYSIYEPMKGSRMQNAARNLASRVLSGEEDLKGQAANLHRMTQLRYALPKEITEALEHADRPDQGRLAKVATKLLGPVTQFIRQQIVGLAYGVPHMANILRKVIQASPGGHLNPKSYANAWKVAFSKELKARAISGPEDPGFDALLRNAGISDAAIPDYKHYIEGNFDLSNWQGLQDSFKKAGAAFREGGRQEGRITPGSALAGVPRLLVEPLNRLSEAGHHNLFKPGGIDQRARLWLHDFLKDRYKSMSDADIAHEVNQTLGRYNRASWTDLQRGLAPFVLFPGWDYSSITYALKHPLKTKAAPALLILLANMAVNAMGGNKRKDRHDMNRLHFGKYSISTNLLNDNAGGKLWGWATKGMQDVLDRKRPMETVGDATKEGLRGAAGTMLDPLNPIPLAGVSLRTNRELPGSKDIAPASHKGKKLVKDYAGFVGRKMFPIYDRLTDGGFKPSWKNLGGLAGVSISKDRPQR